MLNLSDHDLRQLDEPYIRSLSRAQLEELSIKLLVDHKTLRDRVNQTPQNSSIPPGSMPPWTRRETGDTDSEVDEENANGKASPPKKSKKHSEDVGDGNNTNEISDPSLEGDKKDLPGAQNNPTQGDKKRKAGKQPGAPGYGREVELPLSGPPVIHRASYCSGCGSALSEDAQFTSRTGLYVADVEMGSGNMPGLKLTHIKHLYGDVECVCGHITQTKPGRCESEPGWDVELTEWHLAGPMLVSLIVCLSLRMRMSRPRVQEFLNDWLGLWLGKGTISKYVHEAGRASEPLENQMVEEVRRSGLLHADETSWKEKAMLLWFCVFSTATVTLFAIGKRSEQVERILGEIFPGWLMSDGLKAYRKYLKRLRCWAHLDRKAQGLADSLDGEARQFGQQVLAVFKLLREEVYKARKEPPGTVNIRQTHATFLGILMASCDQHKDSKHEKTRALAREFLYDWEAIWTVLSNPYLPMTNNEAEQLLRHWVICRRISYGTRTAQGSRVVALLASVIETCRKRKASPWSFLAEVLSRRRKGETVPSLPAMAVA